MSDTKPSRSGAALLSISDIDEREEPAFHEWYNREHMRDRVLGLAGFHRGRRYVAISGRPKFLALYEAHTPSVFVSPGYVALITNPDPRSRHFITRFRNTVRTIAHIRATIGDGEGAALGVLPLELPADDAADLLGEFTRLGLPDLHAQPQVVAAHLLVRAPGLLAPSATGHVRQGDASFAAVLLVESSEPALIGPAVARTIAPILARLSPETEREPATYRLLYRISP